VSDGRPGPSGEPVAGIDVDRIPPEPAVLVTALAQAIAAVHDGSDPAATEAAARRALSPSHALVDAEAAVARGWTPLDGSPYAAVGAEKVLAVLRDGAERAAARSTEPVPTIGTATFSNLVLPDPGDDPGLSGSANLTFRRSPRRLHRPGFADHAAAALSDPYRDLAVAAADVVATFGPGAVLGLTAAYVEARPSIEPLDPIRLDWWSLVAAVLGDGS
jgi:hypothetical protein